VAVLADLIAAEMAGDADPATTRSIFGIVDPHRIDAMFDTWVAHNLDRHVQGAWHWAVSVGCVAGLTLNDSTRVVIKAYPPDRCRNRLVAVLRLQTAAKNAGLPAPTPLAGPADIGRSLATAEEALDVGRRPHLLDARDRATAAEGWVALSRVLEPFASVLGEPDNNIGRVVDGLYPTPHSPPFDFEASSAGAEWIDALARRARDAMQQLVAPHSVVHKDWRGDNIRVNEHGDRLMAIFDWDSLRLEPVALATGEVAAMHSVDFAHTRGPYFATAHECLGFARAIERARQVDFTADEWSAVRAAILFGWCYTARCEHARASVGDDKAQFGMRRRLASDAGTLATTI
jgi:hypothetical protein